MLQSSWFKLIWIVGSFIGVLYFAFTADERPDPWAAIIPVAFVISFIAAIFYTARRKEA
jgi:cbb3-type cytochrome oxidase subunit 3